MSNSNVDKVKKILKYWPVGASVIVVGLLTVLLISLARIGGAQEAKEYITTVKGNRDILFMNTINGTMMYVPVSENEAIAEATGNSGGKGYYLFTLLGDTVTISDDFMISKQQNMYDMMFSMLEVGLTVKKDDKYITTISNTDLIMKLMTEKWGLTEGQTMGALNNYEALSSDDVQLELILKPGESEHFEFAINIYVEDKVYAIYTGISIANDINKAIPHELYNYRTYEGLSTGDERAAGYLQTMSDYFKEIAVLIGSNDAE